MNIREKIQENINLAPLSTFKIGGPAKYFLEIENKEELEEASKWAKESNEQVFILGGGSNLLINDKGVNGLVVKVKNNICEVKGERMECGAGAPLARAVILASGHNLTGLEWAIGIPGTVGGAVSGNAGAFGVSTSSIVETVETFDLKRDKFMKLSRGDCHFGYRESIFKNNSHLLIWQVNFKLIISDSKNIKEAMDDFVKGRRGKHASLPSAGSVFKNTRLEDLAEANANLAERAKQEGIVKEGFVAAGWLIDRLDLKGKIIGGAKISLEHANFIVNTGKATTEDVVTLISYIKQQVRDKLGVQLQEEIKYFGF